MCVTCRGVIIVHLENLLFMYWFDMASLFISKYSLYYNFVRVSVTRTSRARAVMLVVLIRCEE